MTTNSILSLALISLLTCPAWGQMNSPTNYGVPPANPPTVMGAQTPAPGYSLSPMLYTQPDSYIPRVTGTVRKYSPVEYGRVVLSTLKGSSLTDMAVNPRLETIVQATTDPVSGFPQYDPVSVEVVQVLNRGVLLTHSREEVRLRGLRIPSGEDANEVVGLYGREANQLLTQLTSGKPTHLALGEPLRDKSGFIMAMAYLPDGTELNQLLLTMGYAKLAPEDFALGSNIEAYKAAEASARNQNLGIWSRSSTSNF